MSSYVTLDSHQVTNTSYFNYTIALWMSYQTVLNEGDNIDEFIIPIKMEKYPTMAYDDNKLRQTYNIIGFKSEEPDFNRFDITSCFLDFQKADKRIKLDWNDTFIVQNGIKIARDQARLALSEAAGITRIRVQNIEMYEEPADKALYVIFTMVEFPEGVPIVNVTNLPDPVKLPLPKALENLEARINAGNFKIELPLTTGGYGSTFADTEFGLADVNRDPEPDCPTTAKPETTVATTSSSATTTTSSSATTEHCSNEGNSGFSAG